MLRSQRFRDLLPRLRPWLGGHRATELRERPPAIATWPLSPAAAVRSVDFTIAVVSAELGIRYAQASAKD